MYRKITGTQPYTGSTMPPAIASRGPLTDAQKQTLIDWFGQGALNN
jgi:hypothetical protein